MMRAALIAAYGFTPVLFARLGRRLDLFMPSVLLQELAGR